MVLFFFFGITLSILAFLFLGPRALAVLFVCCQSSGCINESPSANEKKIILNVIDTQGAPLAGVEIRRSVYVGMGLPPGGPKHKSIKMAVTDTSGRAVISQDYSVFGMSKEGFCFASDGNGIQIVIANLVPEPIKRKVPWPREDDDDTSKLLRR